MKLKVSIAREIPYLFANYCLTKLYQSANELSWFHILTMRKVRIEFRKSQPKQTLRSMENFLLEFKSISINKFRVTANDSCVVVVVFFFLSNIEMFIYLLSRIWIITIILRTKWSKHHFSDNRYKIKYETYIPIQNELLNINGYKKRNDKKKKRSRRRRRK